MAKDQTGNHQNVKRLLIKAIIAVLGITIMINLIFTFLHTVMPSWVQDFARLVGFIPFILLPFFIWLYLITLAKCYLDKKIQ